MFSPLGLFKDVPCPLANECLLTNCVFSHKITESASQVDEVGTSKSLQDDQALVSQPSKRRRIHQEDQEEIVTSAQRVGVLERKMAIATDTPPGQPQKNPPTTEQIPQSSQSPARKTLRSTKRPISPPPVRSSRFQSSAKTGAEHDGKQSTLPDQPPKLAQESLNPRTVAKAPQSYPKRKQLLNALHTSIKVLNDQMKQTRASQKELILSTEELISMANEEEEQLALKSNDENIYRIFAGQRVMFFRKMKQNEWKEFLLKKFKQTYQPSSLDEQASMPSPESTQATLTAKDQAAVLRHLRTPLEGLEPHGYVTKAPPENDIERAREGVEAAVGWESCDRCHGRFQVYPGRDAQGNLTSHGKCVYHWSKIYREEPYPCCRRGPGSEGCTVAETHVFKVTDVNRLASILQFKQTPESEGKRRSQPVSMDCEMGYTTLGMELIRLTALSWPQGQVLLDVLVRPYGEVLDLNTRFSGVSKDQFTKALLWGGDSADNADSSSEDGELEPEPLRKAESPAAARDLLMELLSPDTPLIGHAIDNDLNVCRLIHPFVVDTVLLYRHPRGLPIRYGLKMLAGKYLDRAIQIHGNQGHDSKEDAKATGDLVKIKVAEKWKQLQHDGWSLDNNGGLLPPAEEENPPAP